MKTLLILCMSLVAFISLGFSQGVCLFNSKIETPVVSKPTDADIVSVSCTELVIKWKGSGGQTFIVNATYKDPVSNQTTEIVATNLHCDADQNCMATLPVVADTRVSWNVQAVGQIDGRTFYSYPFRGEYAGCKASNIAVPTNTTPPKPDTDVRDVVIKNELKVYPNPVTGELIVDWPNGYNGNSTITIMDMAGRTVKQINTRNQSGNQTNRISVDKLTPGLYFLNVRMKDGKSLTTKFVKD